MYNAFRISVFDHEYQGKYDAVGHALFYLDNITPSNDGAQSVKLYKNSWVRYTIIHLVNVLCNQFTVAYLQGAIRLIYYPPKSTTK